jgi:hypothetical protein
MVALGYGGMVPPWHGGMAAWWRGGFVGLVKRSLWFIVANQKTFKTQNNNKCSLYPPENSFTWWARP